MLWSDGGVLNGDLLAYLLYCSDCLPQPTTLLALFLPLIGLENQNTLSLPTLIPETIYHLLMILNPKLGNTNTNPLVRYDIYNFLQITPVSMEVTNKSEITEDKVVPVEIEFRWLGDYDDFTMSAD
jgi:hypothetical protein